VADFGLARSVERTISARSGGMTPAYAAPEFFQRQVSRQSDQYSLAASYCELRGRRLPFEGSPIEVMVGHVMRSPNLAMLPEHERGIVAKALAKRPQQRWPSCHAFVHELAQASSSACKGVTASAYSPRGPCPDPTPGVRGAMTEAEWMTCTTPGPMLQCLRGRVSERKLRHFACACCQRVWHLLVDPRSRRAVEVAEGYADGQVPEEVREVVHTQARAARDALREHKRTSSEPGLSAAYAAAAAAVMTVTDKTHIDHPTAEDFDVFAVASIHVAFAVASSRTIDGLSPDPLRLEELRGHCQLLRDIVGNPFRSAHVDHAWLTGPVIALGSQMYEEVSFESLPLLGDALEGAGCTDADILRHCREPGEHVRGCWVVDLVLGRE